MIEVELTPIASEQRSALRHLIDLYAYDFSEIVDLDVGEDGRFAFRDLDPYWTDDWRHPFFVRAGGKLAGFALIHTRGYFDADPATNDVAEFFVLRRYRRRGVGDRAATLAFDAFRGRWEVRERANNTGAIAFWRGVIERYTRGEYREVIRDDERWRGPVQSFTNGSAGGQR